MQQRTGELATADRHGAMIKSALAPAWARFLEQLPALALGSRSPSGELWASVLLGQPGLARALSPARVSLDLARSRPAPGDPLLENLHVGGPLAVLAIDLQQRRRLRLNGLVTGLSEERVEVEVRESYPNCSQYITPQTLTASTTGPVLEGGALDGPRLAAIARAHTLFVASHHPVRGLDVSHRGGPAGFVRAVDEQTLRIPDYPGNQMYNTLGNVQIDPRVGWVLVSSGRALQLTGTAELRFEDEDGQPTGGTGRFLWVRVERWREAPASSG